MDQLTEWTLAYLETAKNSPRVLLRDPLNLLVSSDGAIHAFANSNGFTVISAATNLVFRELYERATEDPDTAKILVVDRTPQARRMDHTQTKAPPVFLPDFLAETPPDARFELDLRRFLVEKTGDANWPLEANEPRYARLIAAHIEDVLRAHENLRTAQPDRFTDHDFQTIVAFACLGIAGSAFKKLGAEDYWRIGLIGHRSLQELEALAPEVTRPIKDALSSAPPPFCWFADRDPEEVVRAFYIGVLLSQHLDNWSLLLANLDPSLQPYASMGADVLRESAPKLVQLFPSQAQSDIQTVEDNLSVTQLDFVALQQLKVNTPAGFSRVIDRECYSVLFRALALLMALDNLLSARASATELGIVKAALLPQPDTDQRRFVDERPSMTWTHLREAFLLASDVLDIRQALTDELKTLGVKAGQASSYTYFWDLWNGKKLNRLEYYLSALERLVFSGDFLPRAEAQLPEAFSRALTRIRERVTSLAEEVGKQIDALNTYFQKMVASQYAGWTAKDSDAVLTSQFMRRCLKPNWDMQTENAVVLIFDGMRYDAWDELLKPVLLDRLELVNELRGSSLLPTETHFTRKAITAAAYPDSFDMRSGEDKLLAAGLAAELGYSGAVEVLDPQGSGFGETVRYKAGGLQVYIFELCDKELHNIQWKSLPGGREAPSRPMSFVYEQHIKNIVDTEISAIIRNLAPDTKVFVTADHGFGRVPRERIWIDKTWLNEPRDCAYLNAILATDLKTARAPVKVADNVWEFPVRDLKLPATENVTQPKTGQKWQKQYSTIIFPKTGYALSRPEAKFNPDAFSHGGMSLQEMLIPMAILKVRSEARSRLALGEIEGAADIVEGQEAEFKLSVKSATASGEIRVDVDATYGTPTDQSPLPRQVLYCGSLGADAIIRFKPDAMTATDEERKAGVMERTLIVTIGYTECGATHRRTQSRQFSVRLNPDQVVRRVGNLGSILGLTPKSMRQANG